MSRFHFWRRDLGLQLLALYLLFVLPVVAAALIFDRAAGAQLERDVQAADLALGRSIALETDAFLQQALAAIDAVAHLPEVQSGDPAQFAPLFAAASAARSDINLFYFLDATGRMRYHYPVGPAVPSARISHSASTSSRRASAQGRWSRSGVSRRRRVRRWQPWRSASLTSAENSAAWWRPISRWKA
jgi:hypothetical protein